MYQLAEAGTGPSQASKINPFARIVNAFKLTFLAILTKSTIMHV